MTYEAVINKIKEMENFGSKPGLERITKLLDFVGNPQNKLNCIHVAGTNGKGSVCFVLEAVLRAEGYKTGRYISPSISDFRERISVNGKNIDERQLIELFEFYEPYLKKNEFEGDPVTEFELTTAMAFKFFADNDCDIAIIETGMGGKLDATNVIEKPVCSVITPISLDHTNILGNSICSIAFEKLGIIKKDFPVVVSDNQPDEIYEFIESVAQNLGVRVFRAHKSELTHTQGNCLSGISFEYKGEKVETQLLGEHQFINLSCALKTLEVISDRFPIKMENIKRALNLLTIPFRLEVISKSPIIILDAAHNPHGTAVLADFLKSNFKDKKIYGIVGMYRDKDYETSLKNILGILNGVCTVSPKVKRAESLEKITICAKKYCKNVIACENMRLALERLMEFVKDDDIIIVFGSFSVMRDFKNLNFNT